MLQLVQTQLNASSSIFTRVPMTHTTCAVYAAAGTGSTARFESFLDPCSNDGRVLPVPSMLQLVQDQIDVTQSATLQECRPLRRTTCSTRARKLNAEYNGPIAMTVRSYDSILPDSSTRPRWTQSPVLSILNLHEYVSPKTPDERVARQTRSIIYWCM